VTDVFVDTDIAGVELMPIPGGARLVRRLNNLGRGNAFARHSWELMAPYTGREISISPEGHAIDDCGAVERFILDRLDSEFSSRNGGEFFNGGFMRACELAAAGVMFGGGK
jgi:hypothetical protein